MTDTSTDTAPIPVLAARIARRRAAGHTTHKGLLGRLGPGLITGAADDDPSGIGTYGQIGAQFGYAMGWMTLSASPDGRDPGNQRAYRPVTGHGIASNLRRHYSRWMLDPILGLLLVANMINLGADLGAMAAAGNLLVGGPVGLYVVAFAVGCTWLEIFSRYQRYVSVLKWGSFVLLAYVAVAFAVHVPWGKVLYSTFVPAFSLNKDYVVTVVAVLGTTITPYCFFGKPYRRRLRISASIPPHTRSSTRRSRRRWRFADAFGHLCWDGLLERDQPVHHRRHRGDLERARHQGHPDVSPGRGGIAIYISATSSPRWPSAVGDSFQDHDRDRRPRVEFQSATPATWRSGASNR